MACPVTILTTGLTMEYSKKLSPEMDEVSFGKMLDTSMGRLENVSQLYHGRFDLDPSTPDESPYSLASFKRFVQQGPPQGGIWDGHIIGLGLKRIPQLTELFEDLINTIVVSSKGSSKLLFLKSGADHWEAIQRGFPELVMDRSSGT